MEIPKLYLFILGFLFTYLFGYLFLFKNWDKISRPGASSSLMSLAHGAPALVLSLFSILQSPNPYEFNSSNTPFHNSVLEYSTAYFLMDLLHYLLFVPNDILFIVHHLAALYVLMTCRYAFGHGAVAVLSILLVAEVTTTCQNTWSLARFRKGDSAAAAAVFEFLSPIFYAFFTGVRGVVAPILVYRIAEGFIVVGDNSVLPRWVWMSWIAITVVGIGVSLLWVLQLWIDLYKRRTVELLVKKSS